MKVMKFFLLVLALQLGVLATTVRGDVAYAENFRFFQAQQKTDVWCWAACIQMMLNYHGVYWSQEDVVVAVKGYVNRDTATDAEIYRFLNSWGFDYNNQQWASRCAYYRGAPAPNWLIGELIQNRPLIVAYQASPNMGHVVVLHAADYDRNWDGSVTVNAVQIFDPYTGVNRIVDAQTVLTQTDAHWFVDIRKRMPSPRW